MSELPARWQTWLATETHARQASRLWRQTVCLDSAQGAEVLRDGRRVHNFCSNDYLGLASDPRLIEHARQALLQTGLGAGAAALVCGHHRAHEALAEALADWLGVEQVLLFGSGYQANLAVMTALLGRGDRVLQDRLNHASLLEGGLASGARLQRYRHADLADLARRLASAGEGRCLVASDSVFSMDGDCAPVTGLAAHCRQHEALLYLDEAHALGVLGEQGRGLATADVPLRMGTLGKAFGVAGAFVAGPRGLVDMIQQRAGTAIYTTAPPPALAAAAHFALALVRAEDWRRQRLQALTARLRQGLQAQGWTLLASSTPIQPVVVGEAAAALALSSALLAQGYWVGAIRPPTVPAGTARLRITLSANHSETAVDGLVEAMASLAPVFAGSVSCPL